MKLSDATEENMNQMMIILNYLIDIYVVMILKIGSSHGDHDFGSLLLFQIKGFPGNAY